MTINVNRGEDIVFDAALRFVMGGPCNLTQRIEVLELRKNSDVVVKCESAQSTQLSCTRNNSFMYDESSLGNITKIRATDEDAGTYMLGVSVTDPDSSVLQKMFTVIVRGNLWCNVCAFIFAPNQFHVGILPTHLQSILQCS